MPTPFIHSAKDIKKQNERYKQLCGLFARAAEPIVKEKTKAATGVDIRMTEGAFLSQVMDEMSSAFANAWLYNISHQQAIEGKITAKSINPAKSTPGWRRINGVATLFNLSADDAGKILRGVLADLALTGEKIELPMQLYTDRKTLTAALARKK